MALFYLLLLGIVSCFVGSVAAEQGSDVRNRQQQVDSLNTLARSNSFFEENSRNMTYRYASEALSLAEKIDYKEGIVEALDMMTYWTVINGNIETALVLGFRQLRLAEDIGRPLLLARALRNVGFAAGQQSKSDSLARLLARTQLIKALETARSFRDTLLEASCLNSIGRLYRAEQNFEAAFSFHEAALQQSRAVRSPEQESWALHSIGIIYEARKQYDTAFTYLQKALDIRVAAHHPFGEASTLYWLGIVRYRQKKYSLSMRYLQESIAKCHNHESLFIVKVVAHKALIAIYKEMGEVREELLAHRIFLAVKDSADEIEAKNNVASLQARLDIERSEVEKQLLLRDKRIQDVQLQRERTIRFGGIGGGVFLLFVIGFIFRAMQTARRRNKELLDANNEIRSQKNILEEQATEIELVNTQLHETNIGLDTALNDLKSTQSQLVQSERMSAVGMLTAGVMHEINNPNAIAYSAITQTRTKLAEMTEYFLSMLDEESKDSAEVRKFQDMSNDALSRLDLAADGSQRVKAIVANLQGFSKHQENDVLEGDWAKEIRGTVSLFELQYQAVSVEMSLPATLKMQANFGELNQVLLNMLVNATQAGASALRIHAEETAEQATVSISDNGKGIPPEMQAHIFEPFFSTKGVGNSGLGLSISKQIMERHGGTIRCESEMESGTTFIVELPKIPPLL